MNKLQKFAAKLLGINNDTKVAAIQTGATFSSTISRDMAASDIVGKIKDSRKIYNEDSRIQQGINIFARDIVRSGFSLNFESKQLQTKVDEYLEQTMYSDRLINFVVDTLRDGNCYLQVNENGIKQRHAHRMFANVDTENDFINVAQAYWYSATDFHGMPFKNGPHHWFTFFDLIHAKWNASELDIYGKPLFDSSLGAYAKMIAGEEDLFVRRKISSSIIRSHFIEGADEGTIEAYKILNEQNLAATNKPIIDFYSNTKGSIDLKIADPKLDSVEDLRIHTQGVLSATPVPAFLLTNDRNIPANVVDAMVNTYSLTVDHTTQVWLKFYFITPLVDRWLLRNGKLPENSPYTISWKYRVVLTPTEVQTLADAILRLSAAGFSDVAIAELTAKYFPGWTADDVLKYRTAVNININDPVSGGTNGQDRSTKAPQTKKNAARTANNTKRTTNAGQNQSVDTKK